MTKKMLSLRERIVQINWKDQSSRLLATRKAQLQVLQLIICIVVLATCCITFLAQDDSGDDAEYVEGLQESKNRRITNERSSERVRYPGSRFAASFLIPLAVSNVT